MANQLSIDALIASGDGAAAEERLFAYRAINGRDPKIPDWTRRLAALDREPAPAVASVALPVDAPSLPAIVAPPVFPAFAVPDSSAVAVAAAGEGDNLFELAIDGPEGASVAAASPLAMVDSLEFDETLFPELDSAASEALYLTTLLEGWQSVAGVADEVTSPEALPTPAGFVIAPPPAAEIAGPVAPSWEFDEVATATVEAVVQPPMPSIIPSIGRPELRSDGGRTRGRTRRRNPGRDGDPRTHDPPASDHGTRVARARGLRIRFRRRCEGASEGAATVTLGELYLQQGHVQEAERIFEDVLARDPANLAAAEGLRALHEALERPMEPPAEPLAPESAVSLFAEGAEASRTAPAELVDIMRGVEVVPVVEVRDFETAVTFPDAAASDTVLASDTQIDVAADASADAGTDSDVATSLTTSGAYALVVTEEARSAAVVESSRRDGASIRRVMALLERYLVAVRRLRTDSVR